MKTINNELWYTAAEAAQVLSVNTSMIYRLAKDKTIESIRMYGTTEHGHYKSLIYLSKKSVDAYNDNHTKHKYRKHDKQTIEEMEVSRICNQLTDGLWNWMRENMDDILMYGLVFKAKVKGSDDPTKNFNGYADACSDEKLEEISKERTEYIENGRG